MAGLFTLNAAIWWQISLQQLKHLIGVRCLAAASSMRPALFFIQLGHFSHLFRRYFKEIKSAGSGQCRHGNGRLLTLVHRSAERNRTLCFRTGGAACTRRSQRRPHPGLLSQLWAVTSQQQAGNVRHVPIVDAAEGGHFGQRRTAHEMESGRRKKAGNLAERWEMFCLSAPWSGSRTRQSVSLWCATVSTRFSLEQRPEASAAVDGRRLDQPRSAPPAT